MEYSNWRMAEKVLANGSMYLSTCFFRSLLLVIWENVSCARPRARFGADLDHDDQMMQKGETEYAVYKGHDFGMGIEVVLVQVPRL